MVNKSKQPYQEHLDFPTDFDNCIAHVANHWASLEAAIHSTIWDLADVRPALGACVTYQIQSLSGRLNALLALMKIRHVHQKLIDKVNRFAEQVRGPQELRNRIIHDVWLRDRENPDSQMGRVEITAPKALTFKIRLIDLDSLRKDTQTISDIRETFHKIRLEIKAALPSLPEMSPEELQPLTEILRH